MKPYQTHNKKRRILKKLYLGEFAVTGFEVSCDTTLADFDQYEPFVDDFCAFLDQQQLCFAGGGLESFEGFICPMARYGKVTPQQIEATAQWLTAREEVTRCETSEPVDANYL